MFHLHLCSGQIFVEDREGIVLPDLAAARGEALTRARRLWGEILFRGLQPETFLIEIRNGAGEVLTTVSFTEAVGQSASARRSTSNS
jgi:hypothetical protein